jgi:hypothetical protein
VLRSSRGGRLLVGLPVVVSGFIICDGDIVADLCLVGSVDNFGRESVLGLVNATKKEARGEEDLSFELLSGVLEVLGKLDSLL